MNKYVRAALPHQFGHSLYEGGHVAGTKCTSDFEPVRVLKLVAEPGVVGNAAFSAPEAVIAR